MPRPFRFVLAAVLACLVVARLAAAEPASAPATLETVASLQVEGELDIDDAGRVAAYRIATELPESIRTSLDKDIAAWRFEPVVAGDALEAVTVAMTIALVARPAVDDAFAVQVERVRLWRKDTPEAATAETPVVKIVPNRLRPPRYPEDVIRYSLDASVPAALLVDADGGVVQAEVLQSGLHDVNGKEASLLEALGYFERSALAGARLWTFDVAVNGTPTADDMTVIVPVRYYVDASKAKPGRWHRLSRTALRKASWQLSADEGVGLPDVTGSGPLPGRAPLRMARSAGAALP